MLKGFQLGQGEEREEDLPGHGGMREEGSVAAADAVACGRRATVLDQISKSMARLVAEARAREETADSKNGNSQ